MPLATTRANASILGLRGTKLPLQWVAVGGSGTLNTSDEVLPVNWTTRTSSFGTTDINCVASNGAGLWVAVGNSGKLASSTDGITWTQRTSGFSTTAINWVAYGGGTWVASGGSGKLSTSTDGTTWSAVTTGTSGWSATYAIGNVAYGNGVWVGINSNGTVRTATDPTGAWTSRTSPLGAGQHYSDYHPSFSIWTMGTETGTSSGSLGSSTDGTTWTARSSSTSRTADSLFYAASNSSKIIASGNSGGTWVMDTSTNGTSWSAVTEPTTTYGGLNGASFIAVRGAGENILVGSGTNFGASNLIELYSTTDGSTFSSYLTVITANHIAHRQGHQSIR